MDAGDTSRLSPEVRARYPFQGRVFVHEPGGVRQHVLDEGQGRAVVMVHGNPTWSFFYRDLVRALAPGRRCIVPDHVGCGLSDKPRDYPYRLAVHTDNLDRILAAWDIDAFDLVVHDWGGPIGIGAALLNERRVGRIVVLNTAAFRSRRIPFRINVCRLPLLGALAIRGANAFAAAATRMAVTRPLPDAVKAGYLAPYDSWAHRIATHRFVRDIPLSENHPSYPALVAVEQGLKALTKHPMKIIWGGKDFCFDRPFFDEWVRRFPDAQTRYFEDAGHYVLEDAGREAIDEIVDFLNA